MKISTHHVDPGEAASRVGVCFIQGHDMSQVGELGVLLLKAYLHSMEENNTVNTNTFGRTWLCF